MLKSTNIGRLQVLLTQRYFLQLEYIFEFTVVSNSSSTVIQGLCMTSSVSADKERHTAENLAAAEIERRRKKTQSNLCSCTHSQKSEPHTHTHTQNSSGSTPSGLCRLESKQADLYVRDLLRAAVRPLGMMSPATLGCPLHFKYSSVSLSFTEETIEPVWGTERDNKVIREKVCIFITHLACCQTLKVGVLVIVMAVRQQGKGRLSHLFPFSPFTHCTLTSENHFLQHIMWLQGGIYFFGSQHQDNSEQVRWVANYRNVFLIAFGALCRHLSLSSRQSLSNSQTLQSSGLQRGEII